MELYILIGLITIVLILQIVFLLKKPKSENTATNTNYESNFQHIETYIADEFSRSRKETSESLNSRLSEMNALIREIQQINTQQSEKLSTTLTKNIDSLLESNEKKLDQMRQANMEQNEKISSALTQNLKALQESTEKKLEQMREVSARQNEHINETLTKSLTALQENNEKKLEQMRMTVDEKLTDTLSKRLDSSFKVVGEQLKSVYESLGEMRKITGDVTALQRVLTNVKARGTWAEVQLGNILEQTLTKDQYDCNVSTKNDTKRVEFAVKIPSREKDGETVWLPIDSKFPGDTYAHLQDAQASGDAQAVENARHALELVLRSEAKDIREKYVEPPYTTAFGILFLPFEGLYAEVVNAGLLEVLQRDYQVNIAGPSTMAALLNSLQMGFKTLAIQKRSGEVWQLLGAVKTEFDKFGQGLSKMQQRLRQTDEELDQLIGVRSRAISRKLRSVQSLDEASASALLEIDDMNELPKALSETSEISDKVPE